MRVATLRKWGNSAAIRIPSAVLRESKLKVNQRLEVSAEEGKVIITARVRAPRYKLADLLSHITDENRHEAIDFGQPVGRETL